MSDDVPMRTTLGVDEGALSATAPRTAGVFPSFPQVEGHVITDELISQYRDDSRALST